MSINALDLTTDFPRSPRNTFAGFVVAARALDKCRAVLAGTAGEYHFDCPLDNIFFDFAGITGEDFKELVATGADDSEVESWIKTRTSHLTEQEIIQWNNDLRYKRVSEMPIELQVFLESYIPENIPAGRVICHWFDIYDIEEGRI